jgi:hypothetical protein
LTARQIGVLPLACELWRKKWNSDLMVSKELEALMDHIEAGGRKSSITTKANESTDGQESMS